MLCIVMNYGIISIESSDTMFLKKSVSNGKIYLSFVQGYRDENGKVKQKTIEKIGYLDDLKKQFDDPIAHFKQIAKNKANEDINELVIKNLNAQKIKDNDKQRNLGYIILKQLYNELGLKVFFKNKQKKLKINYDLNSIFELLIYSRILFPASKNETYKNKDVFFDKFDFSLKDLYRSLDYFNGFKDELQTLIWNNTKDKYNRDASTSYYDCTNYYFEITYNDEDLIDENGNILEKGYRKKGPSKEHRPEPIIGLGLLMDKTGIPLSYNLFPGNQSEKLTLRPSLKKTKANFNINRTIVVADRGLNTSDNIYFLAGKNDDYCNNDGYVYGQSVLGSDIEFKDWVLNQEDYVTDIFTEDGEEIHFKHKSRIYAKTIQIKRDGKRTNKYTVYQKQMVYYSKKYADKQKYERDLVIAKAKDLINNPGKYTRATSIGAAGFINNISFDKSTGEVINKDLSLNEDKIKELEKFDGYYSIVTSEKELSDKEIRDIYSGLWKIEETFKITKSELKTRPVYVWTKEHIEAHFLTCFISLVMLRLLQQKTNYKFSTKQIISSLKSWSCFNLEHDIYINLNYSKQLNDILKMFNIDLSIKYINWKKISNLLK